MAEQGRIKQYYEAAMSEQRVVVLRDLGLCNKAFCYKACVGLKLGQFARRNRQSGAEGAECAQKTHGCREAQLTAEWLLAVATGKVASYG